MRLSENQKRAVLESCKVTRPDASLRQVGNAWAAVWRVSYDDLVNSDVKVSTNARWRCQLISRLNGSEVWWSGEEHQSATRSGAIQMAESEASHYA